MKLFNFSAVKSTIGKSSEHNLLRMIVRVLQAEDYLLIADSGTHEAVLIHVLLAIGRSVLLVTDDNSKCDRIVRECASRTSFPVDDILRLGSIGGVAKETRQFHMNAKLEHVTVGERAVKLAEIYADAVSIFHSSIITNVHYLVEVSGMYFDNGVQPLALLPTSFRLRPHLCRRDEHDASHRRNAARRQVCHAPTPRRNRQP